MGQRSKTSLRGNVQYAWSVGYRLYALVCMAMNDDTQSSHHRAWIPLTFEDIWLQMLEIATILSALSIRSLHGHMSVIGSSGLRDHKATKGSRYSCTCKSLQRADEVRVSSLQHRFEFFFRSAVLSGRWSIAQEMDCTYLLEYLSDISDRFRLEKLLCMDLG